MCYFNRLTRVAYWLADYPEWLQFSWDFVKPPRNDEIALQHFFSCLQQCKNFFSISFVLHAIFFFHQALAGVFVFKITPPPPSRVKWSASNVIGPTSQYQLPRGISQEMAIVTNERIGDCSVRDSARAHLVKLV